MSLLTSCIVIIAVVAVICIAVAITYHCIMSPSSNQIAGVKEWLKYAVTLAEKELGSGTGQLKLRFVYQLFVEKFTIIGKYIPFDVFSSYVDEALEWLNKQLTSNKSIITFVSGTTDESTAQVNVDELYFTSETDEVDDTDALSDDVVFETEDDTTDTEE